MYYLDLFFSGKLMTIYQIIVTVIVIGIVWYGYYKNKFPTKLAFITIAIEYIVVGLYMYHSIASGHMAEEVEEEANFILLSAFHGLVSLWAMVHALVAFIQAKAAYAKGQNYFADHINWSYVLIASWMISMLSGIIL